MSFKQRVDHALKDNPLKRVKNFAFACGKTEDLPSFFCSLSFIFLLILFANRLIMQKTGMMVSVRIKGEFIGQKVNSPLKETNINPWLERKKQ